MLKTFFQVLIIIVGLNLILSFVGCQHKLPRKVNVEQVDTIQRAAVVAFSVDQNHGSYQAPSFQNLSRDASPWLPSATTQGTQVYENLLSMLGQNLKWQILPIIILQNHPAYHKARNQSAKSTVPATGRDKNIVTANGIMTAEEVGSLNFKERDQLIENLGVDAIISTKINFIAGNKNAAAHNERKPQAAVMFQVFKKGKESPVWFESRLLESEIIMGISTAKN